MIAAPKKHSDQQLEVEENTEAAYQSAPGVKKMVLINNGDKLSRGRPYVLNANKVRTWENLLLEFSDRLKPTFGAVRRVYTPKQGTEVTDMDQLETNGVYVLSGTEKFKQIPNGYNTETILNQHFNHHAARVSLVPAKQPQELPVFLSGNDQPDLRRASFQILVVHVFRNGDGVNPPVKVMLKKFDLWNLVRAKDAISEKVKPTGGFCKSLCFVNGTAVKHMADLKNNGYYVAVGRHEKFRHVDYTPEGRPSIVVPMKVRTSFAAQTNQNPEGLKRRRTFVVRLKKNSENLMDEEEGQEGGSEHLPRDEKNHVTDEEDDDPETGKFESFQELQDSTDGKSSQRSSALALPSSPTELQTSQSQLELQKVNLEVDIHKGGEEDRHHDSCRDLSSLDDWEDREEDCAKIDDDGLAGHPGKEKGHRADSHSEREAGDHHQPDVPTDDQTATHVFHTDEGHNEEAQKHVLTRNDDDVPTPKKKKGGCCSK